MPLYEYSCLDCGTLFEKLVRNPDKPPVIVCPQCHRENVRKAISTFAGRSSSGGMGDYTSGSSSGSGGTGCSTGGG